MSQSQVLTQRLQSILKMPAASAAVQHGSLCYPDDISTASSLAISYHRHHPIAAMYLPTKPPLLPSPPPPPQPQTSSRYESQKRRDWNTFGQYLRNHRPPLALPLCSGAHVLEFMRYLDQFGKTKVHNDGCPFYGHPSPPASCPCPLRQAWGSLDALVGRLRAAYEKNVGRQDTNPFGVRAVRLYLREVRDSQAKARGIAYEKKRRKKPVPSSSQCRAHQERNRHGYLAMHDHEMDYCGGDLGYGHV